MPVGDHPLCWYSLPLLLTGSQEGHHRLLESNSPQLFPIKWVTFTGAFICCKSGLWFWDPTHSVAIICFWKSIGSPSSLVCCSSQGCNTGTALLLCPQEASYRGCLPKGDKSSSPTQSSNFSSGKVASNFRCSTWQENADPGKKCTARWMTNLCCSAVCSAALSKEKGSALGFRSFLCWSSTLSIPMTICTENSPWYQSWVQDSHWKGGKATLQTRCRASSRVIRVVNHLALDNLPIWPGQATSRKPNFHEYQLRLFSKPQYLEDQRAPQLRARYHLLNAHHKLKQLRCKSLLAYTCKGSLKLSSEVAGFGSDSFTSI